MFLLEVPIDGRPTTLVSLLKPDPSYAKGLPNEAVVGQLMEGKELSPDNFVENPLFMGLMHAVIAARGFECEGLLEAAKVQQDGFVYVTDRRGGKDSGNLGPEDVMGRFEVEEQRIVVDSYQPSTHHRLLTDKGLFVLDKCIYEKLMEELTRLANGELASPFEDEA